mmetsp:Transcript_19282/g.53765  ORF Transcript_19282/g.53765 Transcript_19282/m.53765 type:complete len:441 (+) Transcript_19282:139-1461(+)
MATYCKLLLLATSDGASFAEEAPASGLSTTMLSKITGGSTTCKATLEIEEKPVLTRWLNTVRQCPRLLPLEQKVFVMSSPENLDAIQRWATKEGFPAGNILCNEVPGSLSCAFADGVAGFLQAMGGNPDCTLAVADTDFMFEPEFSIARVIEHAMVCARDCITFSTMNPDITMVPRCPIALEGPNKCPKLTKLDPLGEPMAGDTMLGPLVVLRKESVAEAAALSETALPAHQQLGEFLQQRLAKAGALPVNALNFGECFSVESLEPYMFTNSFYEWYRQQKEGMASQHLRVTEGNIFLSEDTRLGGDVTKKVDAQLEMLDLAGKEQMPWSSRIELPPLLKAFKEMYTNRLAEMKLQTARELPGRFTDAGLWTYKTAKKEHPVFTTTNNMYGAKAPTQPQLANSYFGSNGRFTKTFASNFKNDSLNCGKARSKVHNELNEF